MTLFTKAVIKIVLFFGDFVDVQQNKCLFNEHLHVPLEGKKICSRDRLSVGVRSVMSSKWSMTGLAVG